MNVSQWTKWAKKHVVLGGPKVVVELTFANSATFLGMVCSNEV